MEGSSASKAVNREMSMISAGMLVSRRLLNPAAIAVDRDSERVAGCFARRRRRQRHCRDEVPGKANQKVMVEVEADERSFGRHGLFLKFR